MSDVLATYAFLPWLRRGMASEITRADGTLTGEARAEVPIAVELDAAGELRTVVAAAALFGPGEVAAVDRRVVIRTNPKPGEVDAEPNYFPAVEFDQPDFPWRYTPARADAKGRLRPWIVLAVLAADEIKDDAPAGGDGRLPALTVTSAAALPRLAQSWAWAHAQVEGFDPASETLGDVMDGEPQRVRSRLLAPRRLLPRMSYRAILVPAFERGRLAGLREPLDESVDGLQLAWADDATNVRLPVYFEWRFQTGEKGDFEFLARRLRARAVDGQIGLTDMDMTAPDPALPAAASGPLAFEGALMSPAAQSTPWPAPEKAPFVAALAGLLNRPADALATGQGGGIVAPPLWARWHAASDRLQADPAAQPGWFHELNADPRLRVAAGLGAEIVRRQDQQLMAAAWDQVEGVNEANAELRRAQLAREAAEKLHRKHYSKFDPDSFLMVTSPLQARFRASPVTVREVLRRSPIPAGMLDGQMRRTVRPAGFVARRQRRVRGGEGEGRRLLERLNAGELRARPPLQTPDGMVSSGRTTEGEPVPRLLKAAPWGLGGLALLLLLAAGLLVTFGLIAFAAIAVLGAAVAGFVTYRLRQQVAGRIRRQSVAEGLATPEDVRSMRPPPEYVPALADDMGGHAPVAAPDIKPGTAAAKEAVEAFRAAFTDLAAELSAKPLPGPVLVSADLPALSRDLLAKMNPRLTIPAAINHRLKIAGWVTWSYDDPLEPIMAAPEFDAPMYEPLRDYGQDWLLPGVGRIPPDTVTLVISNQRFIEAYMAGLSHEMARELLYHEYPTDQRGTYFKQFWDVRGAVSDDGGALDAETLRDIKPIHGWERTRGLGVNSGRTPAPRDGHLVFLIKGELLRRYPGTLVYAVKTEIDGSGQRTLGPQQKFPVFEGRLDPDIAFFGFDLVADDVRGDDADPQADQGWYFMLQEQPTEPLFGLDADDGQYGAKPVSWSDMSWAHLAASGDALGSLGYIDLDADLPDTSSIVPAPQDPSLAWHADGGSGPAGANGSDLAHITLQRPFRMAIHGSDILPPEPAP